MLSEILVGSTSLFATSSSAEVGFTIGLGAYLLAGVLLTGAVIAGVIHLVRHGDEEAEAESES